MYQEIKKDPSLYAINFLHNAHTKLIRNQSRSRTHPEKQFPFESKQVLSKLEPGKNSFPDYSPFIVLFRV